MCSIFGVLDIKTDAVELRKKALELSRLMRHRGPDWSGVYASDKAILAHERLSIVDVNAGAQPLYNEKKHMRWPLTAKSTTTRLCVRNMAIATSSRPVLTVKLSSRCIRKKAQNSSTICKVCSLSPCMTAKKTLI
jgi:glutamine phosphoribosylpyrophosphate amidotransferase